MLQQQDIINTLNTVVAVAQSHAQAEPDLDARRIWLRLEGDAEELLVHYGQRASLHAQIREQARAEVMQELGVGAATAVAPGEHAEQFQTEAPGESLPWWKDIRSLFKRKE